MHVAIDDLELDILYVAYPGAESYALADTIHVRSVPGLIAELCR